MKKTLKSIISSIALVAVLFTVPACQTPQGNQALANIAQTIVDGVATYYAGPVAGQKASDGLYAIAKIAQGYIGNTIPAAILEASPGVKGIVGAQLAGLIAPNRVVTQSDVDTAGKIAAIAATLQPLKK